MKDEKSASNKNLDNARMKEVIEKGKGSTVIRLLSCFGFHKGLTMISILLALIINLSVIINPYILKNLIDNNLAKGIYKIDSLMFYASFYFLMVVIGAVCSFYESIVLTNLGQKIMHKLRTQLFAHIQKLNMEFFNQNSSGKILTRINSDIESLSEIFSNTLIVIVRNFLLIIGIIIAMFSMDTYLALWCLMAIPVVIGFTFIFRQIARKTFKKAKAQLSKLNSFLAENIIGMKIVQIFASEKIKEKEFHEIGEEYYKLGVREVMINGVSNPLVQAISSIMTALLIGIFAYKVDSNVIEVGVIYAFTMYIRQLFNPIAELSDQFTGIQSAIISADRVFDILDTTQYSENFEDGIHVERLKGDIEFRNVWFEYTPDEYVLKNVSFKIKAGQTCAFVGETGCGKSTIIALLARFYPVKKGEILIDGINILEYNLLDLRKCIAVVMQDVFLFSGDIRYNIRLNNNEISDENIHQIIRSMKSEDFFDGFSNGYDQTVSERGNTFSAGQRQIISFARAMAFKPSILILDEATANIDPSTELILQNSLEEISNENTVIIIAHRISTIISADLIIVMSSGEIVQQGTHNELYQKEGLYKTFYDISIHVKGTGDCVKSQ